MKYVFAFILFIHGIIHVMGFMKAFLVPDVTKPTQNISKPIALIWLLVFILFMTSTLLYLIKENWWISIVFIAVLVSQILIFMHWKEAKFGTLANLIILVVVAFSYGNYQFNRMVKQETTELLKGIDLNNETVITPNTIKDLPPIIQKWLNISGVIGKKKIMSVHLKQKGEMKTKPEGKWMPFKAQQYFNAENPSFIWTTKVNTVPLIFLHGRDKLENGVGEMLIKLGALIPVVNEGENEKINSDTMLRFLAETCWFPSATLNDYISWETISDTSAKAIFTINGKRVSGIFKFSVEGDFISFETQRYYGGKENATLEKWHIEAVEYIGFNGVRIPNKCKVTWKLKDGDFNWLNLEIIDLEYNTL